MNETIKSQGSYRLKGLTNDILLHQKRLLPTLTVRGIPPISRLGSQRIQITSASASHNSHYRTRPHRNTPKFSSQNVDLFFKPPSSSSTRNSLTTEFNASEFKQMRTKVPLRRYNSDDSQAVFTPSPTGKDTQQHITTSLQHCSTSSPESTGHRTNNSNKSASATSATSATSAISHTTRPEYELREFLERFSLPRVVKVSPDGRPLLLYKFFDDYVNIVATSVATKRKKETQRNTILYFPEAYQGWFSLTNDEGNSTAVAYTSIIQLVQEQVYTFLSTTSIVGYVINPEQSGGYVKHTCEAGDVYQLRGIFQHNPKLQTSHPSKGRDLANRYAQLMNVNKNQELFVPLISKGCYYEISSPQPQKSKPSLHVKDRNPLFVDKDCIYRLSHIVKKCTLPITVKLVAGQLPKSLGKNNIDTFLFQNKTTESVLFACVLPMNTDDNYQIKYFNYQSQLKISRTLLGFDSEHRMLQSCRVQNAFAYCRTNCDTFCTRARTATEWNDFQHELHNTKLFNSGTGTTETESNNNSLLTRQMSDNTHQLNHSNSRLNKLKWFKNFKLSNNNNNNNNNSTNESSQELSATEKLRSIDRYKDMSKLIEERFGAKKQSNPVKKSASFMFATRRDCLDKESSCNDNTDKKIATHNFINRSNNHPDLIPCRNGEIKSPLISNSLDSVYTDYNNSFTKNHQIHQSFSQEDIIFKSKNSYITDRLCSKFHVKTKNITKPTVQKSKNTNHKSSQKPSTSDKNIFEHKELPELPELPALPITTEDLPYISAVDALQKDSNASELNVSENIYVEICEDTLPPSKCQKQGACKMSDNCKKCIYCNKNCNEASYVHLDSTNDIINDEPIYSTLK